MLNENARDSVEMEVASRGDVLTRRRDPCLQPQAASSARLPAALPSCCCDRQPDLQRNIFPTYLTIILKVSFSQACIAQNIPSSFRHSALHPVWPLSALQDHLTNRPRLRPTTIGPTCGFSRMMATFSKVQELLLCLGTTVLLACAYQDSNGAADARTQARSCGCARASATSSAGPLQKVCMQSMLLISPRSSRLAAC